MLGEEDDLVKETVFEGIILSEQDHPKLNFDYSEHDLYLLDEPEAALSPSRQLAFLRILYDLTRNGEAQFIIATHSPILLGYPDCVILSFSNTVSYLRLYRFPGHDRYHHAFCIIAEENQYGQNRALNAVTVLAKTFFCRSQVCNNRRD